MTDPNAIARLLMPPRFQDEDTNRNAAIIYAIALATFAGICLLLVYRFASGHHRLLPAMAVMAAALVLTVVLVRRGLTAWAGSLLLWTLLVFLTYLAWTNDGIRDTAFLAIPAMLVVAGLVLRRRYFTIITAAALVVIVLTGVLEIRGVLVNPYSGTTAVIDIVDVAVIVGLTALIVRLMTKDLFASLQRARNSEKQARENADRSLLSETRYRLLFNSGNDAVMVHGFDERGLPGRFLEVNDIACRRLGYSREELLRMSPLEIDDPETVPGVPAMMEKLRAEKVALWEGIHRTRDGQRIHVEISNHLFDLHGQPTIIAIVRDITERKRADEQLKASLREKEVLLREIHHRVKNNMQVISSLLSLESARVGDPTTRQHFLDSMNRIHSMALVHEKLYRSGNLATIDFGEYLTSVTDQLMRLSHTPGVTCTVRAERLSLSVDTAIPCGLIVNELVTNALKHAFGGRDTGKISVTLTKADDTSATLTVRDDGVGFPDGLDFRTAQTMGLSLVVSLTHQIGGTVDLQRSGGTTFVVNVPM